MKKFQVSVQKNHWHLKRAPLRFIPKFNFISTTISSLVSYQVGTDFIRQRLNASPLVCRLNEHSRVWRIQAHAHVCECSTHSRKYAYSKNIHKYGDYTRILVCVQSQRIFCKCVDSRYVHTCGCYRVLVYAHWLAPRILCKEHVLKQRKSYTSSAATSWRESEHCNSEKL